MSIPQIYSSCFVVASQATSKAAYYS